MLARQTKERGSGARELSLTYFFFGRFANRPSAAIASSERVAGSGVALGVTVNVPTEPVPAGFVESPGSGGAV